MVKVKNRCFVMFLLDTHVHSLIFRIDDDVPQIVLDRWNVLKCDCEEGEGRNEYVIDKMKTYCRLVQNKSMPYLQRFEGGIGGNNNTIHKQMRFRSSMSSLHNDRTIVLADIVSTSSERWTYEELDDLIYAFRKSLNHFVKSNCVNGLIGMSNVESLSDNYLDSDDAFD